MGKELGAVAAAIAVELFKAAVEAWGTRKLRKQRKPITTAQPIQDVDIVVPLRRRSTDDKN